MLEKIEAALVADIAKYYIHVGHALTESGVLKNIVKLWKKSYKKFQRKIIYKRIL